MRLRWPEWIAVALLAAVIMGVGYYIGWRQGMRDERDRIERTPNAESNWWKGMQR